MNFKLECVSSWNKETSNFPRYLEQLKNAGFNIILDQSKNERGWIENIYFIEIETLDKLLLFQKIVACEIVLNEDTIEIYDDYRE